jgi:hypothetical protein
MTLPQVCGSSSDRRKGREVKGRERKRVEGREAEGRGAEGKKVENSPANSLSNRDLELGSKM